MYTVFCLPCLFLPRIHVDRKTKWGIAGTFLLGIVTISICTFRFVWGDLIAVFPITVILLCTSEFTTALIVVCLPILRQVFLRQRDLVEPAWPEVNEKRIEEALKEYAKCRESSLEKGKT